MKYKVFILASFLLVNLDIFSQNDSKFCLETSFSPEIASVHIFTFNNKKYSGLFKDINIPKFGFTTGFNLNYKYKNNIKFQAGILVSNKGFRHKKSELISIDPNDPTVPQFVIRKFNDYYIELPISIYFKHQEDEKLKSEIGLGFSLGYFVFSKDKYSLYYEYKTITSFNKKKMIEQNLLISLILLSYKAHYQLNEKFKIIAEPIFRYQFYNSSNTKFRSPFINYYNLGVSFGLGYNLINHKS